MLENFDSFSQQNDFEIREWQKLRVEKSREEYRKDPSTGIDFDEAMDEIDKELE